MRSSRIPARWIDSGYYNFSNTADSYCLWRFHSDTVSGPSMVTIRFANGGKSGLGMDMEWNGKSLGGVPFAQTGAWTAYDSVTVEIQMAKGLNVLRLSSIGSGGGPNVDGFEFNVPGIGIEADIAAVLDDSLTFAAAPVLRNTGASLHVSCGEIFYDTGKLGSAVLVVFGLKGQMLRKKTDSGQGTVNFTRSGQKRFYAVMLSKGRMIIK